ncbi:AI-2E family transporter [Zhihengliuella salsuginis]|uniref:AI-2E family transporter n=1 Tax=Zhihengliuella salsuginis TaxID=578222 RepID=A0ABQ3GIV9_9MICC|nr:AI-2E family transporter [Zhihengliuella salsuginis]GHD09555.1 AI-2E family transporter [Zhihengliuella salsuginis]
MAVEPEARAPRRTDSADSVSFGVRVAASWAWRLAIVIGTTGLLVWLLGHLSLLIVPLMIAALLSGLLSPIVSRLRRMRVPSGLAVGITLVAFLGLVSALVTVVSRTMARGFEPLWLQAVDGLQTVEEWVFTGPLQFSNDDMADLTNETLEQLRNNSSEILSEALSWGSTLGHIVAGILLALFALIFFLLEGQRIWAFIVRLLPGQARLPVDGAGRRGWRSLVNYVRVQLFVAFVDALGIGIGAVILGVPLAVPLGVLVFMGSFIPILGALVTGTVAVLLALVANGWVNALIMLIVVLAVQQAESHILQPLVMGKAVSLHPLAVVLAVAGGTMLAGIAGALFAVPLLAIANTVIKYLADRGWEHDPSLPPAAAGPPPAPAPATGSAPRVPDAAHAPSSSTADDGPAPADLDGEEPPGAEDTPTRSPSERHGA